MNKTFDELIQQVATETVAYGSCTIRTYLDPSDPADPIKFEILPQPKMDTNDYN